MAHSSKISLDMKISSRKRNPDTHICASAIEHKNGS